MAKNHGYFEFSFAADSILTGTYGNNANPGVVFPEMARKIEGEPGLAGRYESFWLERDNGSPNSAELVIEQIVGNPFGFRVSWKGTSFVGVGNLLAPDRFVGWYGWD
jgi:hypothetical protein